jgi:hypothetical protein
MSLIGVLGNPHNGNTYSPYSMCSSVQFKRMAVPLCDVVNGNKCEQSYQIDENAPHYGIPCKRKEAGPWMGDTSCQPIASPFSRWWEYMDLRNNPTLGRHGKLRCAIPPDRIEHIFGGLHQEIREPKEDAGAVPAGLASNPLAHIRTNKFIGDQHSFIVAKDRLALKAQAVALLNYFKQNYPKYYLGKYAQALNDPPAVAALLRPAQPLVSSSNRFENVDVLLNRGGLSQAQHAHFKKAIENQHLEHNLKIPRQASPSSVLVADPT